MSAGFFSISGGRSARITLAVCGSLLAATLAGCGGSGDPFSYVKMSGSVKYTDGTPINAPRVRLIFVPQDVKQPDPKTFPPNGNADVKSDGTFDSETSHKPDDGLLPGKHKVLVLTQTANDMALQLLDPKYGDPALTPLLVDTANPDSFNLKVEKPTKPVGKGK
jgi:hypothetical protein